MTRRCLRVLLFSCLIAFTYPAVADGLFTLKLRTTPGQDEGALLKRAVLLELGRLSGEARIDPAIARYFTKRPRRWIQRYFYSSYRQDGVVVGQWLNLVFDRKRLLEAMTAQGLPFWPLHARPRLLLTGHWMVRGTKRRLDAALLRERPDLNLIHAAYLLGIRVVTPDRGDDRVRRPVLTDEDVRVLRDRYGIDGVLRLYFEDGFEQGRRYVRLYWESLLPDWQERLNGTIREATPVRAFRALLQARIAAWRGHYQMAGQQSGQAELVLKTQNPEDLLALERLLRDSAPPVVHVQLVEARKGEGCYTIRWQGGWQTLQALIERMPHVRIVTRDQQASRLVLERAP